MEPNERSDFSNDIFEGMRTVQDGGVNLVESNKVQIPTDEEYTVKNLLGSAVLVDIPITCATSLFDKGGSESTQNNVNNGQGLDCQNMNQEVLPLFNFGSSASEQRKIVKPRKKKGSGPIINKLVLMSERSSVVGAEAALGHVIVGKRKGWDVDVVMEEVGMCSKRSCFGSEVSVSSDDGLVFGLVAGAGVDQPLEEK
ncbi:unnamed protein product [Amaranthus hypochondriacus]